MCVVLLWCVCMCVCVCVCVCQYVCVHDWCVYVCVVHLWCVCWLNPTTSKTFLILQDAEVKPVQYQKYPTSAGVNWLLSQKALNSFGVLIVVELFTV